MRRRASERHPWPLRAFAFGGTAEACLECVGRPPGGQTRKPSQARRDLTVHKHESGRQTPWPNDLPEEFRQRLLAGVVGFEMPMTRIEGKYKLGQNRSSADQAGMLAGLLGEGVESRLLADFMARNVAEA
jgi:predicted FMN-binding regulatory protein PaiB